ncbi:DUF3764 family protein [Prochlorococcus marinus]|nr:DUF3764 family protein [Prochlorococcus marinus]
MAIEITVFDFKISKTFDEWRAVYDSVDNKAMLKAGGIIIPAQPSDTIITPNKM